MVAFLSDGPRGTVIFNQKMSGIISRHKYQRDLVHQGDQIQSKWAAYRLSHGSVGKHNVN
jgi:hypothetical protein